MTAGTMRFLIRFARSVPDTRRERELLLPDGEERRAATLYLPGAAGWRRPAWVLLHGVTVPGRHHEGVRRIARALAAAGQVAIVPEVPSWTSLRVDPAETSSAIASAVGFLRGMDQLDGERLGLIGFSVAGTWALIAAAGQFAGDFRVAASFGGYGAMQPMLRAMVVGEHEWHGRRHRYAPDPYGRWILGAELLPLVGDGAYGTPEDRRSAADALHRLAYTAGRNGALADAPVYDPLIAELRASVPSGALPAWDLLASGSSRPVPDREAGLALADALADAGVRAHADLEPAGRLGGLDLPVVLIHGHGDRLIPFTESLRLASMLPPTARVDVNVTGLIGHAKAESSPASRVAALRDLPAFSRTISRLLAVVGG